MIQAIQTKYNGYLFRSRLEARWAVFFDAVGLKYDYEVEGFNLSERLYLPDFYLRDLDLYVEVKPFIIENFGEYERLGSLFQEHTPYSLLIVLGDPYERVWDWLYAYDTCDSGGGASFSYAFFGEQNGDIKLIIEDGRPDRTFYSRNFDEGIYELNCYSATSDEICKNSFYTTKIQNAALRARQARFEHGETP